MIVITGGTGFIAKNLIIKLNSLQRDDIVIVDDLFTPSKLNQLEDMSYKLALDRFSFLNWLARNHQSVEIIVHLGARTDTTEPNQELFDILNFDYTRQLWQLCCEHNLPIIYASSAATYGNGDEGYEDDHDKLSTLKPVSPYAISKHQFDLWMLEQPKPSFWAGFKFFNVYGPFESHKAKMASMVLFAHKQIVDTGKVRLFRSHHPDFKDGEQTRDFIYVKDVVDIIYHFMQRREHSGIYNIGTGEGHTFNELITHTFQAMGKAANIEYFDMPERLRGQYQYYTKATIEKLRSVGYDQPFRSLEDGITDYVQNYL